MKGCDMSQLLNPTPTWELRSQRQRSNDTDHCEITSVDLYCGFTRICIIVQEHPPRLLTANNIWSVSLALLYHRSLTIEQETTPRLSQGAKWGL